MSRPPLSATDKVIVALLALLTVDLTALTALVIRLAVTS